MNSTFLIVTTDMIVVEWCSTSRAKPRTGRVNKPVSCVVRRGFGRAHLRKYERQRIFPIAAARKRAEGGQVQRKTRADDFKVGSYSNLNGAFGC